MFVSGSIKPSMHEHFVHLTILAQDTARTASLTIPAVASTTRHEMTSRVVRRCPAGASGSGRCCSLVRCAEDTSLDLVFRRCEVLERRETHSAHVDGGERWCSVLDSRGQGGSKVRQGCKPLHVNFTRWKPSLFSRRWIWFAKTFLRRSPHYSLQQPRCRGLDTWTPEACSL